MKRVKFGKTGYSVSEFCLGTMTFGDRCDEAESDRIVTEAMEAGVDMIDTAPLYQNGIVEEILGQILKGRRKKVFLVSKVRIDMAGVVESIEQSLKRLQTDYLDLYLIHAPVKGMDPEKVMRELDSVVRAGKTRYVGCSNYPAWLVSHSNGIAYCQGWPEFICNQIPYSLLERGAEVEVLQQAYSTNLAIMAYRPLGSGPLAGRYKPGASFPDGSRANSNARIADWVHEFSQEITNFLNMAAELGVEPATLALAWLRSHPAVTTPIVGTSSVQQLKSSLQAFEFELTQEQFEQLGQIFAAAEVKEISGGMFGPLRRDLNLVKG